MQDDWRGVDFPRDREIMIRVDLSVPARWSDSLGCWVLTYPLNVETVHRPYAWKPKAALGHQVAAKVPDSAEVPIA